MTTGEREQLHRLVRDRAKLARHDAEARGKAILADAEARLAAIYKIEDEAWADITAEAEKKVAEADAAMAAICRQRGISEEFRPSLHLNWYGRGVNASKERRAELRRVAQAQVAAQVAEAKVEIDREQERQFTQLAAAGLTSPEALAFLRNMPSAVDLLPPIRSLTLAGSAVVALEQPPTVTADPDRNATVTAVRNGVTEDTPAHGTCADCGKTLASGRGRYCSDACRQSAYRQRRRCPDGQGAAPALPDAACASLEAGRAASEPDPNPERSES
jgi:hypothetical protein